MTWSYSAGDRGATVRVYERTRGGVLQIAAGDPTVPGGRSRRSLGHRNKRAAAKEARRISALLESGSTTPAALAVGYLLGLYRTHHLPSVKPRTRRWLGPAIDGWERFLGRTAAVRELGPREWEAYKRLRLTGAIDLQGREVAAEKRRAVTPGTVNLMLDAIMMPMNWALVWRVGKRPLLDRNPFLRLAYLADANPERAIWTHDRFETVLRAAERHTMVVEWSGHRERIKSHLADVLFLCEATGRRVGAVRQLRGDDLRLSEGKYGKVEWPANTDKKGRKWLVPITREVRDRFLGILRRHPVLGAAPLFPAPRAIDEPVGEAALAWWLHAVLEQAKLPRLAHDRFHGLRRKFPTERKHLADIDNAEAGGWRSIAVMKRCYQQADEAGVLEALEAPKRLRERSS